MSVRSPYTKKQYTKNLKLFFDYIGLQGNSLEEQAQAFLAQARRGGEKKNNGGNPYWTEDSVIMLFLELQKPRVLIKKSCRQLVLAPFVRLSRLFCDAHEFLYHF